MSNRTMATSPEVTLISVDDFDELHSTDAKTDYSVIRKVAAERAKGTSLSLSDQVGYLVHLCRWARTFHDEAGDEPIAPTVEEPGLEFILPCHKKTSCVWLEAWFRAAEAAYCILRFAQDKDVDSHLPEGPEHAIDASLRNAVALCACAVLGVFRFLESVMEATHHSYWPADAPDRREQIVSEALGLTATKRAGLYKLLRAYAAWNLACFEAVSMSAMFVNGDEALQTPLPAYRDSWVMRHMSELDLMPGREPTRAERNKCKCYLAVERVAEEESRAVAVGTGLPQMLEDGRAGSRSGARMTALEVKASMRFLKHDVDPGPASPQASLQAAGGPLQRPGPGEDVSILPVCGTDAVPGRMHPMDSIELYDSGPEHVADDYSGLRMCRDEAQRRLSAVASLFYTAYMLCTESPDEITVFDWVPLLNGSKQPLTQNTAVLADPRSCSSNTRSRLKKLKTRSWTDTVRTEFLAWMGRLCLSERQHAQTLMCHSIAAANGKHVFCLSHITAGASNFPAYWMSASGSDVFADEAPSHSAVSLVDTITQKLTFMHKLYTQCPCPFE